MDNLEHEEMMYSKYNSQIEDILPAWRTKPGKLVLVQDMEDNHIKNCIKLIQENPGWRTQYLEVFKKELIKRKYNVYKKYIQSL